MTYWETSTFEPISEEQLTALLAKLNDEVLQQKLMGAADLDSSIPGERGRI